MEWKQNLNNMLSNAVRKGQSIQATERRDQTQINEFFSLIIEAFEEIKVEVEKHGRRVEINSGKYACPIDIYYGNRLEFNYAVKVLKYVRTAKGDYSFYSANSFDPKNNVQRYNLATIHKIDKERIIRDFMRSYQKHLANPASEK